MNGDCSAANECECDDEQQMNGYFSFLKEESKTDDLVDPQLESDDGVIIWHTPSSGDDSF